MPLALNKKTFFSIESNEMSVYKVHPIPSKLYD